MTMLAEPRVDVAAVDRADRAESARALITVSEEKRCPRCQSLIPPECVAARPKTDPASAGAYVRTVLIYCPPCRAGFEADFETRDGFSHQVSTTRVVLDTDQLRDLKRARATVRGDVFVERISVTMEDEHAVQDEADCRELSAAIARTRGELEQLEARFAERFGGATACVVADPPFDAPAGQSLGGVPAPARSFDPSTSQLCDATGGPPCRAGLDHLENQRRLGGACVIGGAGLGGGDDGPVDTWDHERFDGMS
jgi:hypothetical protein